VCSRGIDITAVGPQKQIPIALFDNRHRFVLLLWS
jgi:hypothetical protein